MDRTASAAAARAARLDDWLQRYFFFVLLVAIALGLAGGESLYRYKAVSPYLLAVTMAIATSRSRFRELALLARRPSHLAALLLIGYGVVGASAIGLSAALLGPASPAHAGFTLLWLGPTATISSLWTHMARGSVALAITLTAASVFGASMWLSPLFFVLNPAYRGWGAIGPQAIRAALWSSTIGFVLVPAMVGMAAGQRFERMVERIRPLLGLASKLCVLAIVLINTSGAIPYLHGSIGTIALVGALTVAVELVGHGAAWAWARWVRPTGRPQSIAIAYTGAMRNTALAITLATLYLEPQAAMAPITAFIVQEPLSVLLARVYLAEERRPAFTAVSG